MLARIAIDAIDPNPDQPRKAFDEAALRDLAASIEETGLMQPITVRPAGGGRYMIVAGERRWRAHKLLAGEDRLDELTVLCQVRRMNDAEMAVAAIVENLQRTDISPLEEADAFARLAEAGMDAEEIARRVGASVFRVRWRLQLLNLAPDIRHLFAGGHLDRQQAMEIARLPDESRQHHVLGMIRRGRLVGWKAVRNAVDAILDAGAQTDLLGEAAPIATAEEVETVSTMERRIETVAKMVGAGWKDGECVVASRVDPDRAGHMADRIAAIQKAIRIMERELRNAAAQTSALRQAA